MLFPPTDPNQFDNIDDVIERLEAKTAAIANDTKEEVTAQGRFIDVNNDGGWNIYFVFDASNSVGEANFKKGLDFAKALVSKVS